MKRTSLNETGGSGRKASDNDKQAPLSFDFCQRSLSGRRNRSSSRRKEHWDAYPAHLRKSLEPPERQTTGSSRDVDQSAIPRKTERGPAWPGSALGFSCMLPYPSIGLIFRF